MTPPHSGPRFDRARRCQAVALLAILACTETNAPQVEFEVIPGEAMLFVGQTVQLTASGAPGNVVWSTSNASVATVVAQTGFVRAVGRGEATISALSGSLVATALVNVLVPPTLGLSAAGVEFEKPVGGADPPSRTVTVTNAGDGTLTGISVGTITYGEGQPADWLTVTSSGSTAPATLTLTARGPALPRGVYTASVPVLAPSVANSPQNLAVTFRVQTPASIVLSRTTVPIAAIPGATTQATVEITNGGDRPLTGLSTAITYGGQTTGWLEAQLSATSAPATLTLTANASGLAVGSYSATVRVASSVEGVAAQDVALQLTVSPGPAIALDPSTVNVHAVNGANPAPVSVLVTNGGGGTLSGLSLNAPEYGAGQPTGWLNAELAGATAPTAITLNITSAALATGSYTATLRVNSSVASNSPLTLTVNLTVGPPPNMVVSPPNLTFATWSNAPSQYVPGAQQVHITNSGGGTLSGLEATVTYNQGTNWLNVPAFLGGTTAPTVLVIRPQTAGLPPGTYTATVRVTSSVQGVTPRTINVTYTVQSFTLHLYPLFQAAGCQNCHSSHNTAMGAYNQVIGKVVPGNPATSELFCRIITGTCFHGGGTFSTMGLEDALRSWILAGAPFF